MSTQATTAGKPLNGARDEPSDNAQDKPVRAIVLSGGGARGAYEAGVLAYLLRELPPQLWQETKLNVLCGASVGAVHACYLASNAHLPGYDIERLLGLWRSFRLERTLRLRFKDVARLPIDLRRLFTYPPPPGTGVIINSNLLQETVVRAIAWTRIRHNLRAGFADALAVSAMHIASGKTTVFVDRPIDGVPVWSRDTRVVARAARMGPVHAMASAALPFFFPPIAIDGCYYCDGGLRQNTPLSPALRLGANRVLVIGLRYDDPLDLERRCHDSGEGETNPGPIFLIGKILDALMLDHMDYDLARLDGLNKILRDGRETFGPSFIETINRAARQMRGASYREVDTVLIRPSCDIGRLATEFVLANRPKLGGIPGWLLGKAASSETLASSDAVSFLLFDGRFAQRLIELGMADADAVREQLISFLRD